MKLRSERAAAELRRLGLLVTTMTRHVDLREQKWPNHWQEQGQGWPSAGASLVPRGAADAILKLANSAEWHQDVSLVMGVQL